MRKINIHSATVRTLVVTGTFCTLSMPPDRAWSSDDVATGLGGFEPHNAVVNPLNPSQVAVMQGCTVLISNAFGQDGFPVVWNTNQTSCGGDPSLAFDSQGRLFLTHLSRLPEQSVMAAQIPDLTTSGTYNSVLVSQLNNNGDDKQWLAASNSRSEPDFGHFFATAGVEKPLPTPRRAIDGVGRGGDVRIWLGRGWNIGVNSLSHAACRNYEVSGVRTALWPRIIAVQSVVQSATWNSLNSARNFCHSTMRA